MDAISLIMSMIVTNKDNTVLTGALMLLVMNIKPILEFFKNFFATRLYTSKQGVSMKFDAVVVMTNKIMTAYEKTKEFMSLSRMLSLAVAKDPSFKDYNIENFYGSKFIVLKKPYKMNAKINVNTCLTETECKEQKYTYLKYSITLSTGESGSFVDVEKFVDTCLEEYAIEQKKANDTPQIYIFKECHDASKTLLCTQYDFNTTKSFDNTFFDDKEKVLAQIDYFTQNKKEYERLGIPHTLGMLIHGPPGTSKTSFIKSLAKYTGRHIFILPTRNIKNIDTLKNIFSYTFVNNASIPNSKRLYVFEEIDCGEWKDVVTCRELKASHHSDPPLPPPSLENIVEKIVGKTEVPEEKMTLTLGDFLELLEGLSRYPGG